jgi:hypothetical protein
MENEKIIFQTTNQVAYSFAGAFVQPKMVVMDHRH